MIVFFLFMHNLLTYMETLESYCSPTANLFAHLFIFCTVLYLSRVEYPGGISHQQPKAV